jgi:hypothetical protein|tara:strand:- start:19101 stop:19229 length:129 start_codon:yes stop_codon:yes gene_type:complete
MLTCPEQVLYKRRPVKFEPLPKTIDDNTEVRQNQIPNAANIH